MEAADVYRHYLRDNYLAVLAFSASLLIVLLFVVGSTAVAQMIIADVHHTSHQHDHILAVSTASAPQPRGDAVMPVGPGGSGAAGAVEEGKGFYAGRPLFKVPPSSPCRAKAERC